MSDESLQERFDQLAATWQEETGLYSSAKRMAQHPAYQAIVAMGEPAIPLILRALATDGGHWFYALAWLTGAQPVPPEDAGRVERMAQAWLAYGREHGYLND